MPVIKREIFLRAVGLRVGIVLLILVFLPTAWANGDFWKDGFHFQTLFHLTADFLGSSVHLWWLLAVSMVLGLVWFRLDDKTDDPSLYYWLYSIARYRLAIGMLGYGMIKLFPLQFPEPTLSDLNTAYGDLLLWKVYYLTVGAAHAGYQPALGALELLGAGLLIFRRTAIIGGIITTMLLLNTVAVNIAYQLGDLPYSCFLLLLSFITVSPEVPKLYRLLVRGVSAYATDHYRVPHGACLDKGRKGLKVVLLLFVLLYAGLTFSSYSHDRWRYPNEEGGITPGFYQVHSFQLNGQDYPEQVYDSLRWKDVVFEQWNVFSISKEVSLRDVPDRSRPEISYHDRRFGHQGNAGRIFFRYHLDSKHEHLRAMRDDTASAYTFHYKIQPDSSLFLWGQSNEADSLKIVLKPVQKKYLLLEGRRKGEQKF